MPSNRAHKAAVRAARQPGENYTTARRRLENAPSAGADWELDGVGLGVTEYTATLDDRTVTVLFFGDHKAPWPGFWDAVDVDQPNRSLAAGRYRFAAAFPDDVTIAAALAVIETQLRATLAGEPVDCFDASHGDPLTPDQLTDGALCVLTWGTDGWTITTATAAAVADEDDADAAQPTLTVEPDVDLPGHTVTWTGAGWVAGDGTPVGVHAP